MRRFIALLVSLLALCFLVACQSNQSSTSSSSAADGQFRIVSTTVTTTEVLDKLGLDLVGVPETSKTLPERYQSVTTIGSAMGPNAEIIASLKPTDIISVSTIKGETKESYGSLESKVTYYDFDSVDGMYASITKMGKRFDKETEAQALIDSISAQISETSSQVSSQTTKPKVLILMGLPGSYLFATEKSYIGNLVSLAGGENVITETDSAYISSNTEYIQDTNPDIILRLSHAYPSQVKKMYEKEFKTNTIWQHFKAVQEGKVYDLDEDPFGITANIRAGQAVADLYQRFYGGN
ncbi:heme ABC transporter substrate-binding protein IsdE [Streptococcus loxodontisalivarius]|uniref:High-affinity heme uptake system protein IsdE n=1 Tax=Streptococcus loxodontisalivarius TaxID=1349415 RepID=A0ABS2PTN1_9STRE|nr:heme ABC transporter substrate-binding protein IsdE [Streptococcus loxodontisalivarius]MBM7642915.1 iron complex transport system substrate-binding protein [Streptococcus loxodontisalivarius]